MTNYLQRVASRTQSQPAMESVIRSRSPIAARDQRIGLADLEQSSVGVGADVDERSSVSRCIHGQILGPHVVVGSAQYEADE